MEQGVSWDDVQHILGEEAIKDIFGDEVSLDAPDTTEIEQQKRARTEGF